MLMPRKTKHRKQQRGRRAGNAKGGTELTFGDFGIQATESGWLTARQIEAARIAMTRHVKRGGKVWIRVFPDKPVTQKPAETRMGSGKGNPEFWVAVVKPGRVLFELGGVDEALARSAMERAIQKLPMQGQVRHPPRHPRRPGGDDLMAKTHDRIAEMRLLGDHELVERLAEARRELFNLRFQLATGQLDSSSRLRDVQERHRPAARPSCASARSPPPRPSVKVSSHE